MTILKTRHVLSAITLLACATMLTACGSDEPTVTSSTHQSTTSYSSPPPSLMAAPMTTTTTTKSTQITP